jgi:hypothetical protein
MSRFYFKVWLRWLIRLTLCSSILALLLVFLVTLYIYVRQGLPSVNDEVFMALVSIFKFWFALFWSFTLLLALFRGLKYVFNSCHDGYRFKLYSCDLKEELEYIGYGDLVKIWRKFFMLIIWIVASLMVLALSFTYFFTSYEGVFEWFSIYWLFSFVAMSGYFTLMLLPYRCKRVEVAKC